MQQHPHGSNAGPASLGKGIRRRETGHCVTKAPVPAPHCACAGIGSALHMRHSRRSTAHARACTLLCASAALHTALRMCYRARHCACASLKKKAVRMRHSALSGVRACIGTALRMPEHLHRAAEAPPSESRCVCACEVANVPFQPQPCTAASLEKQVSRKQYTRANLGTAVHACGSLCTTLRRRNSRDNSMDP